MQTPLITDYETHDAHQSLNLFSIINSLTAIIFSFSDDRSIFNFVKFYNHFYNLYYIRLINLQISHDDKQNATRLPQKQRRERKNQAHAATQQLSSPVVRGCGEVA